MPRLLESNPTTHATPVHKLPHDLLSYIFDINANMFLDDGALNTTRWTSQVCRAWRKCMLATPSLWGRLIDFDYFYNKSTFAWGHELLRRSDNSMLWIKSRISLASRARKNVLPFFDELLQTQRHRIQRLVTNVPHDHWISQRMIDPLFLPWPCLEELRLLGHGREHSAGPLFANQAPALRQLEAHVHRFDPTAPWLRDLCSLHIGSQLTVLELLSTLSLTTNLKDLNIGNVQFMEDIIPFAPRLPSVPLPWLRDIFLAGDFNATLTLLHHLEIPPSCALHCILDAGSRNGGDSSANSGLLRALSKHARQYFQAHTPKRIKFLYCGNIIYLYVGTPGDGTKFVVSISQRGEGLPQDIVAVFLTELTSPQLGQATELCLSLDRISTGCKNVVTHRAYACFRTGDQR